jgi:hypothetical protein
MRHTIATRFGIAAVFAALLLGARGASAQRLGIDEGHFTVDGERQFLTFISYFGAMGAQDVGADLDFLKASGFNGVRIWPNSPEGPQLMREDGTLNPTELTRLLHILELARDRGIIVDVTFTAEHIQGLDAAAYREAIARASDAMREHRHVLVDIENERNLYGPARRPLAPSDVAETRAAIKAVDPDRIVTASNSQDLPAADAARFTADTELDVTAYHDPRVSDWFQFEPIDRIVRTLAANGRPVYLQEPTRFPNPSTHRASFFLEALANAKRAGAAAWCFHTDLGFNLRESLFRDKLESRLEPEWAFVVALTEASAPRDKRRPGRRARAR